MHDHQNNLGVIFRKVKRPSNKIIKAFSECYSAFILDHLGKEGYMSHKIKPLENNMKICGPAVTVLGADLTLRRMAINLAKPGDVIVVAAGGVDKKACFGDGTALKMMSKQIAGVVIDGFTRDAKRIIDLNFPTFVRGVTPRNHHYPIDKNFGGVNIPIICGGVSVKPGDIIFADADGVVVTPKAIAASIANKLITKLTQEKKIRETRISHTKDSLEKELKERGYVFK